jgi:hypothetical protein
MADIFISYSKKDVEQARLIAALLEAQGYSVWWDTSLETGDEFRQEITEQLDTAKAVVALWTEHSVKSVWVNAEASRAHSDRKLVPLKARLLPGDQIPLPFSELHTTNFDNHEAVLAAVKTQLAKPPAPPAVWKKVRYEALTWFGIVGGALTTAARLSELVRVADWMRAFLANWLAIMHQFWSFLGALVHLSVPKPFSILLSLILFYGSLTGGVIIREGQLRKGTKRILLRYPMYFWTAGITVGCTGLFIETNLHYEVPRIAAISVLMLFTYYLLSHGGVTSRAVLSILLTIILIFNFNSINISMSQFAEPLKYLDKLPIPTVIGVILVFLTFPYVFFMLAIPVIFAPADALIKRVAILVAAVSIIFGISEVSKLVEHLGTVATQVK